VSLATSLHGPADASQGMMSFVGPGRALSPFTRRSRPGQRTILRRGSWPPRSRRDRQTGAPTANSGEELEAVHERGSEWGVEMAKPDKARRPAGGKNGGGSRDEATKGCR